MSFTRRELLFGAGALPLLASNKPEPRPNIVLISADGIGAWMLGCYGNRDLRTPGIDLLAAMGTRFSRSFACSPEPAPSRATLLSGRTPRQFGIAEAPATLGDAPLLSDLLAKAGYTCGYSGLWELGGAGQHSFSSWHTAPAEEAEAITARALEFLDAQKPGQPFLLVVGHGMPGRVPAKYDALYASVRFEHIGWTDKASNAARGKEAFSDVIGSLKKAGAAVSFIDAQVPPVLDRLNKRGLRDGTLIVFTSTCGSLLGRHGLWDSGRGSEPVNMYQEAVGVPMIWSWVRVPPQAVRPEVINLYDLVPTLAEAARAGVPSTGYPGRSYLRSALNEPYPKKHRWHNLTFGELLNTEMVSDGRFKLVARDGGEGPGELYDEVNDPGEQRNQYDNRSYVTVRQELAGRLAAWRKTY